MKCPFVTLATFITQVVGYRSTPGETAQKTTKIAMVSVHKTCQLLKGTGGDKKNPLEKRKKTFSKYNYIPGPDPF